MSHPSHRRNTAAPASQQPPMVESLEDRKLLSAVSLSSGGTLYVEGTRRADDIVVRRNPENRREIEVRHNGESETFSGRIRRIVVVTGGGDDSALVDRRVAPASTLEGGAGDDSLYGGAGDDSLNGDVGDDSCVGGAGDDSIRGGDGADDCDGSDGDDSIRGESGRDRVHGGGGDDAFDNNREVGDDDPDDRRHRGQGLDDGPDDNGGDDTGDDNGGDDNDDNSGPGSGGSGVDDNSGRDHPEDDGTDDANDDHGGLRALFV
jgi:hypothetical protein